MRKTLCASVLVLALCGSALAGEITNPPSPATTSGTSYPVLAAGDISSPPGVNLSSDDQTADGLAEAALWVIDSVLGLF
jgi:hypothetical protein